MSGGHEGRRAARLAAVQALYQMEMSGGGAGEIGAEFIEHRFAEIARLTGEMPDERFFTAILDGVPQHQVEIDRAIAAALSEKWSLTRVDSILRAILRAAVFELVARRDVPVRAVIDEYVAMAGAFFGADEPGFVNAALDTIARRKRAAELGLPVPDDEPGF
jgi:N utilization substance protein B